MRRIQIYVSHCITEAGVNVDELIPLVRAFVEVIRGALLESLHRNNTARMLKGAGLYLVMILGYVLIKDR
jgi:hypothetical protein